MRSISKIYPASTENTECSIVRACTPFTDFLKQVCYLIIVYHYASLHFQLFEHFGQHSKQRITQEAPLLALYLPQSLTKAIMRILQIVTYAAVEKGMENKGKLRQNRDAGIGAAAVGTSRDEVTLNSAKIKPITLAVIELRLSEGISK